MARLVTDGAEMGDNIGYATTNFAASTSQKRSGNYSYYANDAVGLLMAINPANEIYVRFGYYTDTETQNSLFAWQSDSSTVLGNLTLENYLLKLKVGASIVASSAGSFSKNTWYLFEVHIKIADSGGVIEVKVDGLTWFNYSGDTKPSTASNISHLRFAKQYNGVYFDDIAVNDTTGAVDNSWCGDGHAIALVPNANGDLSQLTGSDGNSTDNYLLVDETPSNSDTDYVEGSTVDQKDLYNLSASGLSNVNILRVWGESRSKDTTTAGGLLAITLKTEGTEYDSGDIALSTSYAAVKGPEYRVNPQTGVAWTVAELDALQVGPKTRS